MEIEIPNGWEPRDYQEKLWHYLENGGKRAVAVWHRRAGKDANCLNWAATAVMQKPANYWHMLPKANQARKAIWDAVNPHTGVRLIDQAFPHAIRETTKDQEMMIRFKNGSTWQVLGSDNYNALVGSPPAGVVFSEYSLCDPAAWDYIRPILAENGGWAFFIYTARGRNHGYSLYNLAKDDPTWFGELLTVDDTGALPEEVLEQEKRELIEMYGEDEGMATYLQEYHCSWDAAIKGSYYGTYMAKADNEDRICGGVYDKTALVHTAWDLGVSDDMVIVFYQTIGKEIRIVDHYAVSGAGMEDMAQVLEDKAKEYGYRYGNHYAPHDVAKRELGTNGKRVIDVAYAQGIKFIKMKQAPVQDGIQAVRSIMPKIWWEKNRTRRLRENMVHYRRKYDDVNKVFLKSPLHDFASHDADAIRTLAMAYREPSNATPRVRGST